MLSLEHLCCPICKGVLEQTTAEIQCLHCGREYPIVDGVPDFFISENETDWIDSPNKTWLDPKIVAARDTAYHLSIRELKGMAFCMDEMGQRTVKNSRILEVGMGTGHFTRWLAEVSGPDTVIYAFDFSWPIIEKARALTKGFPAVRILRANARGRLPFQDGFFDILLLRLVPLGPHGVPNLRAGYELLKPGGWYFEAGWEQTRNKTPPTEFAMAQGYEYAEHHKWRYWRTQTAAERTAARIERAHLAAQGGPPLSDALGPVGDPASHPAGEGLVQVLVEEHLLMARKPDAK